MTIRDSAIDGIQSYSDGANAQVELFNENAVYEVE